MPKHDYDCQQLNKKFSAISEEKSFDELQPWIKKAEEMEIIQSILGQDEGNFTVL